jgi:hypothetical protein
MGPNRATHASSMMTAWPIMMMMTMRVSQLCMATATTTTRHKKVERVPPSLSKSIVFAVTVLSQF